MTIEPHHNLTITLMRRNQFSALRLRGSVPRRIVRPRHIHRADRAKVAPPLNHCRRDTGLADPRRVDGWQHTDAWPFAFQSTSASSDPYGPAGATPIPTGVTGTRLDTWA